MSTVFDDLYEVVLDRKAKPVKDSYTCYLFEQGLDKILKKCGEETAEMLIAAKNGDRDELIAEIGDLLYHIWVLMAETDIRPEALYDLLEDRRQKVGNLKPRTVSVKES
ncbi:MAG: phosphoribosyl-ATP diphosphatase [Clostridiales bacterium]|nr:phosphoribosyl-ATP diphosphatase [Clostridiales bacterium]